MPIDKLLRLAPLGLLFVAGCADMTEFRSVWEVNGEAMQRTDLQPYELGKAHLAKGRLGLAATAFSAALAREPESVAALNALAATYDRMGRYDLADQYYARALAAAPDDAQTLNNAGYSRYLRGDHGEAQRLLAAASRQAPQNPLIAGNLAITRKALAAAPQRPPAAAATAETEVPARPRMLVERTGPGVHTLTMAGPEFLAAARKGGIDPKLAAVSTAPPPSPPTPPQPAPQPTAASPEALAIPRPTPSAGRPICRLEVSNGVGRARMAKRLRGFLNAAGVEVGCLTNAPAFTAERTVVYYREGFAQLAQDVAARLPVAAVIEAAPDQRNDVRVLIGRDLLPLDQDLVKKETSHAA